MFRVGMPPREVSFRSSISVSRASFSARSKETFGGAIKEGFNEIVSDSHTYSFTR